MASNTRQDRALMRQRGAGSRTVAIADFGINFGLGDSRQERHQMRQRGAGSRKIYNVDFGISFPTPSQRSSTKTPQSRRSTSRQPSNTPSRRGRESTSARSTRQISSKRNSTQLIMPPPEPEPKSDVAHTRTRTRSTKRRKTSPAIDTPTPQLFMEIPRSRPTSLASLRNSSRTFTIAEDDDAGVSHAIIQAGEQHQTSPLFVPQEAREKENATPDDGGSKGTVGSDLQTTKSGRILFAPFFDEIITESASEAPGLDDEGTDQALRKDDTLQDSVRPGSSKQQKRRRRRPLTLERRRRRSSTPSQPVNPSKEDSPPGVSSQTTSEHMPSAAIMSLADRIAKYSKLTRPRKRAETPPSDPEQAPDQEGEEEDDSYVEQSSPEVETPAAGMKDKRKTRRRISRDGPAEVSEGKRGRSTFPILTHRLTSVPTLPTIHEDGEAPFGDALADVTNDRAPPNVVDVLAQICRETISNTIDRIAETTQPGKRTALNNKRGALEAFGKDLDDELFAMSEAVENRINLEARVRKTKREKAALQAEYIELRTEREQVALKCDALRRRHWDCEEATRQKWTLSEAARRVEQELDRNMETGCDRFEFLIRSVTTAISSASGHGGILDRVKSFNAQLENMASALEESNV
ncbi:uncharacterized protein Z519_01998 [Cladophialophora bantiana CBS 173.52]|uniref:Inner kinetochore subunit AME1 domain-containing protein n=1 Tax=Cladophialophora bantiana (strain ATCC 10958 / CBS 173.52 / CDC B-1940 / NIH 8579) TaxID=1442370 RepID=A0A0D2GE15_CLAB1|nr:uncharacterized protein Z519_01998 [Cladophialophora bantiana CBS 173.52]KIW96607.1 hypothetical protein Z519_01998 [Cladophialophora bantiana CBS 173.52]